MECLDQRFDHVNDAAVVELLGPLAHEPVPFVPGDVARQRLACIEAHAILPKLARPHLRGNQQAIAETASPNRWRRGDAPDQQMIGYRLEDQHAFEPAGSDAQIGPPLDDLAAAAEEAGVALPQFVRQSIVDPDAVITPDYQPGVMPKDFAESLSPEELDALVAFLSGEEGTE